MKKIVLIAILILVLIFLSFFLNKKIFREFYRFWNKKHQKYGRCITGDKTKVNIDRSYKIITSCTTSPTRIYKMKETFSSLENQTLSPDNMILNLPYVYSRTNETYTIPEYIKENKNIIINRLDMDYGPATKSVGAILNIPKDEDTWIIIHDDDQLYLENTIQNHVEYINKLKSKKVAFTISGFKLRNKKVKFDNSDLAELDILEGFCTFSVHRSIFEEDFLPYILNCIQNIDCKLSDDLIISNYLAYKNVKILKISNEKINKDKWIKLGCELEYGFEDDALHKLTKGFVNDPLGGNFKKYLRAIDYLEKNNMYYIK